jgi:hypothetical protein
VRRYLATITIAEPRCGEIHIEVQNWRNWNDLLRYVIAPLSDQGFAPEMRGKIEVSPRQPGIPYTLDDEPL